MYFRVGFSLILISLFLIQVFSVKSQNTTDNGFPPNKKYKLEEKKISDLFPYVRWFISLVLKQSNSTLEVIYNSYKSGKAIDTEEIKVTIKSEAGLIACIILALLLAICIPLIGLFFCCCRICGNCGGKKIQKISTANNKKRRYFFIGSLTFLLILILLGTVSIFIASSRVKDVHSNVEETLNNALDDIELFVNGMIEEIQYLNDTALFKPIDGIEDDLNDMESFGRTLQSKLDEDGLFNKTVDLAMNISEGLGDAVKTIKEAETNLETIKLSTTEFLKNYKAFKKSLDDEKAKCTTSEHCNELTIGDIEEIKTDWHIPSDTVKDIDNKIKQSIKKTVQQFDEFPSTLKTKTIDKVQDAIEQLHEFKKTVANSTSYIDRLSDSVHSSISNETKFINSSSFKKDFQTYNHFVYLGFIGLTGLVAIIWLFLGLGLLGGIVFFQPKKLPTERSCSSNCSGILLIMGIIFIFLFSSLLWIITIPFFVVGSASEVYVCDPLYEEDSNFPQISKYFSKFSEDPDTALSKFLFNNASVNLSLSSVLSDCKNNQPIYTAFQLHHLINIDTALNYSHNTDLEKVLDDLPNTIQNVQLVNEDFHKEMEDAKSALNINIPPIDDDLLHFDLENNFTNLENTINQVCSELSDCKNLNDLNDSASDLKKKSMDLMEAKNEAKGLIETLHLRNSTILEEVKVLLENIKELNTRVATKIKMFIKDFATEKLNRTKESVQSSVQKIKTDFGKCKPLWNLFDSSRTLLCRNILDSLNGFWFGLGWCLILFLPSVIFGMKLTKYYRRMDHIPSDWNDTSDFHTEDAPLSLLKNPYPPQIPEQNRYSYGGPDFHLRNPYLNSAHTDMIGDDLKRYPPMYR